MKKYMILFLVLTCIFSMTGCTGKEKEKTTETIVNKTYFKAVILEVSDTYLLVEPLEDTLERKSADKITVSTDNIEEQDLSYLAEAEVGDTIEIGYNGYIGETYPAQISAASEIKLIEKAEIFYDKIVMVDGKLYYDTKKESPVTGRCGVMDGEITSTVDAAQIPTEDNQSNFGTGYSYQYGMENTIEIYMNEKWVVFEEREEDSKVSPIEN